MRSRVGGGLGPAGLRGARRRGAWVAPALAMLCLAVVLGCLAMLRGTRPQGRYGSGQLGAGSEPAQSLGAVGSTGGTAGDEGGTAGGSQQAVVAQDPSQGASDAQGLLLSLAAAAVIDGNSQVSAVLSAEVPDAATELLDAYRRGPTCLLAHESYLDLSGSTWGCVIQGEGWVDVCVVQATTDGESQVSLTRMHVDAWAEDLEGEVWDAQ